MDSQKTQFRNRLVFHGEIFAYVVSLKKIDRCKPTVEIDEIRRLDGRIYSLDL
jgi:hypothetical protein